MVARQVWIIIYRVDKRIGSITIATVGNRSVLVDANDLARSTGQVLRQILVGATFAWIRSRKFVRGGQPDFSIRAMIKSAAEVAATDVAVGVLPNHEFATEIGRTGQAATIFLMGKSRYARKLWCCRCIEQKDMVVARGVGIKVGRDRNVEQTPLAITVDIVEREIRRTHPAICVEQLYGASLLKNQRSSVR